MAKLKKKKINIGAIVAAVGALVMIISFFIPFLAGKASGQTLSGMDLTSLLFGGADSFQSLGDKIWIDLITSSVPSALTMLQLSVLAGIALGSIIFILSILGIFVKVPAGRLILRVLSIITVIAGAVAIICTGVIQSKNTAEVLGQTIVSVSMHAGSFMLAIGSAISLAGAMIYKKKR